MNGLSDFEQDLERELHRILDPIAAAPIPLRTAPQRGGFMKRLLGGAGAALAAKAATGFVVAALAAAVAGAATEVAVTGSLNPADWGRQVSQTVEACKDNLTAGTHGIGACVSDFAKQHGKIVSNEHKASTGKGNGKGTVKDNGKGNGNGNGQPGHKPKEAPVPPEGSGGTVNPGPPGVPAS